MPTDELYFSNSFDMTRRVKPIVRMSTYSGMSSVDEVVFGHDLEGTDKDGDSLAKEAAFADSGGASSSDIGRIMSRESHIKHLQVRDQMDNILHGHEMQETSKSIEAEMAFNAMQKCATPTTPIHRAKLRGVSERRPLGK